MLDWAERQLRALAADESAFNRKQPYRLTGNYYWEGSELFAVVRIGVAEFLRPTPDVVFRVGDILHNMRVAADYLAFAVGIKQAPEIATDAKRSKMIYFPIFLERKTWDEKCDQIAPWAKDATQLFEFAQPFNHFMPGGDLHPLYILHELDRPHKHRNLLSAAPAITNVDYRHLDEHAVLEPVSFGLEGPFADGTVIARYKHVGPEKGEPLSGKLETTAVFELAFDPGGPAKGQGVIPTLTEIADYLRKAVFPLFEKHL
jgi:hypothetical protein